MLRVNAPETRSAAAPRVVSRLANSPIDNACDAATHAANPLEQDGYGRVNGSRVIPGFKDITVVRKVREGDSDAVALNGQLSTTRRIIRRCAPTAIDDSAADTTSLCTRTATARDLSAPVESGSVSPPTTLLIDEHGPPSCGNALDPHADWLTPVRRDSPPWPAYPRNGDASWARTLEVTSWSLGSLSHDVQRAMQPTILGVIGDRKFVKKCAPTCTLEYITSLVPSGCPGEWYNKSLLQGNPPLQRCSSTTNREAQLWADGPWGTKFIEPFTDLIEPLRGMHW